MSRLGFDPHLEAPTLGRFRELIARRSGTLKGLLLNQGFAAGVGNWIADEVLFAARLDPRRRANSLSAPEQKRLWTKLRYVVEKGSIAVDGISLTVNKVDDASFAVALIPHTVENTSLAEKHVGRRVNIEVDIIGKYVERLLGGYTR